MMRRSESSVKERKAYTKRESFTVGLIGNNHINSNNSNMNIKSKTTRS